MFIWVTTVSDFMLATYSSLLFFGVEGHRLAWNLRDSPVSAAQAGFQGNGSSWFTSKDSEKWSHWAHPKEKETTVEEQHLHSPKGEHVLRQYVLQRKQFFYSCHTHPHMNMKTQVTAVQMLTQQRVRGVVGSTLCPHWQSRQFPSHG